MLFILGPVTANLRGKSNTNPIKKNIYLYINMTAD